MPKSQPPFDVHVSDKARRDIRAILAWSEREFGKAAAVRHGRLLVQALRDIGEHPEWPGSTERPELMINGARTYHIECGRGGVDGQRLKAPRHFLLYRRGDERVVEVGRVIHDSRELGRHLPKDYRLPSISKRPVL